MRLSVAMLWLLWTCQLSLTESAAALLFEEHFEETNFKARGWYDGAGPILSNAEHIVGSTRAAEFHWARGARTPDSGGAMRRKFTPTESVYIGYWVKYSSNYTGSNKP